MNNGTGDQAEKARAGSVGRAVRRIIHYEPDELSDTPAERCSECGIPTRAWATPYIPLCPICADGKPNTQGK